MRAARYYGIEDIRVEEIEEPLCKEGHVKIKPAFVGICGTDLHEYLGGPTFAPQVEHPVTGEKIPVTFGHEFVSNNISSSLSYWSRGRDILPAPFRHLLP